MALEDTLDGLKGVPKETGVVADGLRGGVNLMGEAGRELPQDFEFLRLGQLNFHGLPNPLRRAARGHFGVELLVGRT